MTPIAYRMTVDSTFDSFPLHVLSRSFQYVVARLARDHVLSNNVLHPVSLSESLLDPLGDIVFSLPRSKNIAKMLRICIQSQSRNAKVHVKKISILYRVLYHLVLFASLFVIIVGGKDRTSIQNSNRGVKPCSPVPSLYPVPHPPLHIFSRSLSRHNDSVTEAVVDDSPRRLLQLSIPRETIGELSSDVLHSEHLANFNTI